MPCSQTHSNAAGARAETCPPITRPRADRATVGESGIDEIQNFICHCLTVLLTHLPTEYDNWLQAQEFTIPIPSFTFIDERRSFELKHNISLRLNEDTVHLCCLKTHEEIFGALRSTNNRIKFAHTADEMLSNLLYPANYNAPFKYD